MAAGTALFEQVLNGLTIGMVYVLLAAGLSIIFGVMDVINFAHGELFALGAYFAVSIAAALGDAGFWVALVAAPLLVGVAGAAMEYTTVRPLYGRNPLYHILLTFGLVLVLNDLITLAWGAQPVPFSPPPSLAGTVEVLGFAYSRYNYFIVASGAVLAAGAWAMLNHTRFGVVVRAGAQDRGMVRNLGIDIDRYYTLVFGFGAALAAFGGIVLGAYQSVGPGMGASVIIPAFVIVVLGGLGSFRGAVVGGLLVGVIQVLTRSYLPVLEGLVVFGLMIVVLLVRPQGLFGDPQFHDPETDADLLTATGEGGLGERLRGRLGVAAVALLAAAPLGVGTLYSSYVVNSLLLTVLVWALFALSLDLVMGYTGLVSLGHVMFYGLGAYATVLAVMHLVPSVFVALALAMAVAAIVAWVVGHLSIRVAGVYFAMITLAFAELFHQLVFKFEFTGGSDGLFGFDPVYGLLAGPEVDSVELFGGVTLFYYLVLALVVAGYLVSRRLIASPFGSVLTSIRESETRSSFLGYDVTAYKRRAFVVSGALGGLAGGLAAIHNHLVAPSFLHWLKSGEVIVMTLLGGMGTLYGPMVGAGVYFGARDLLMSLASTFEGSALGVLFEQWQGILGLLFVLFVVFVPRGLVSLPGLLSERRATREGGEPARADREVTRDD
jgi:branched-chain amino acid transport system permease protein